MDEFMTPAEFQENLVEMFPSKFEDYQNNPYLPPQLRALNTEPESLPESQTLTQEDINNSPNLQRLNAQPGDKIINGVLHDANGNPKQ